MADGLSKIAEFMLGPRTNTDEDEFESDFDSADEELTDIVDMESLQSVSKSRARSKKQPPTASVTSIDQRRRVTSTPMSQIRHERPQSFSQAAAIGEHFNQGATIILNLASVEQKQAQRFVDFTSGMAFATGGRIEEITSRVYMLIPAAVEFSESDKEQLRELTKTGE